MYVLRIFPLNAYNQIGTREKLKMLLSCRSHRTKLTRLKVQCCKLFCETRVTVLAVLLLFFSKFVDICRPIPKGANIRHNLNVVILHFLNFILYLC